MSDDSAPLRKKIRFVLKVKCVPDVQAPHDHSQAQNRIKSKTAPNRPTNASLSRPVKTSRPVRQDFNYAAVGLTAFRPQLFVVCFHFFIYCSVSGYPQTETGVYLCYIPPARREILYRNLRTTKRLIAHKNTNWFENESERK